MKKPVFLLLVLPEGAGDVFSLPCGKCPPCAARSRPQMLKNPRGVLKIPQKLL